MSRIHEALKKAAEERSSRLATDGSNFADVAGDVTRSSLAEQQLTRPQLHTEPRKPADSGRLQFEDLVKKCAHPKWKIDPGSSVFHGAGDHEIGAERFRTLRSRLHQIAGVQPLKKILVTSSLPAEGKTFVASNLANSIVRQNDRRVLLIDADLRASRLHQTLGAPSGPGLSDYLRGDADEFAIIQNGLDNNLCFIAGGTSVSNPSELLLGDRMKRLLDFVSPLFDWIILDSPPALPVHDASMLAGLCDGVLFVVRAGRTDFEMAEKASSEFRDKNLLGVVLNCVEKGDSYGTYYYGYPGNEKERT